MIFSVHVEVRGLEGIADPEGRTIERALPALGFGGVRDVRVGKVIRFTLEAADDATAEREAEEMCRRLLANPVIEQAEVTITRDPVGRVTPRIAVVVFPGSNCEHDVVGAVERLGGHGYLVWHESRDLEGADGVVVPGGFAHGDYLRPGAIARFSPVMDSVAAFAEAGRPVLGICNGFQVLTEAGLVPGALRPNEGRRFLCKTVTCTVETSASALTSGVEVGAALRLPINHYEGNYTIAPEDLATIEARGQVVLRYAENPNGSMGSIAGVANERGNVVGLMPHPERASDPILGSGDGVTLLEAFLRSTAA